MLKLPPASHHVKRHLQPRELQTIAAALELLARAPASDVLDDIRAAGPAVVGFLTDDEMRALGHELVTARKVKVCRSKRRES